MSDDLELGAFSISLSVADLEASRAFYRALGFTVTGGSREEHYLIMLNGRSMIGLFHGMFEGNILTFNPGIQVPVGGEQASAPAPFTDVRDIQARLRAAGIELIEDTEPDGTGPAHLTLQDPDGNAILIDQFSDRPDSSG